MTKIVTFLVHASSWRDFHGYLDSTVVEEAIPERGGLPEGVRYIEAYVDHAYIECEVLDRVELEIDIELPAEDVDDTKALPTYRIGGSFHPFDPNTDLTPLLDVIKGEDHVWDALDSAIENILGPQHQPWTWYDDVQVIAINEGNEEDG